MGNKVRIIARSKYYSHAEIVDEEKAEDKLEAIARLYWRIQLKNNMTLPKEDQDKDGLLVTTTLIKE